MPAPRERTWPPVTYWMKVTAAVLVVVALARAVTVVAPVLVLLVISLILAVGLQPIITWLEGRGLKRGWALAIIVLVGAVVAAGFLAVVVPIIVREVGQLVQDAPRLFRQAQTESELFRRINEQFDLAGKVGQLGETLPETALSLIRSFTGFVFSALTVFILTLYFAAAMPRVRTAVARLLRRDDREDFERILEASTARVGGYVMGNLTISAIAGVVSFIVMLLLGMPYPAALAFWVALTDLVPTIGAILGAIVAVTVAAFVGVPQVIGTAVFFLVYQQVENYLIAPRVFRKAVDMTPATVIIAVLIGGTLAGVVGALLAIPVAAVVKVALQELYVEDRIAEVEAEPA